MVDCSEFLEQYSEYRDGRLSPERWAALRAHLGDCPSCARYDRVVQSGVGLVRQLPELHPSEEFMPRLQHRIFHLEDELRRSRRRSSGMSLAVSLALALALAAGAWFPLRRARTGVIELPPVLAHAPQREEAVPLLFRGGLLVTPPELAPAGTAAPAAHTLLFRYSPLGSYTAQAARVSRPR